MRAKESNFTPVLTIFAEISTTINNFCSSRRRLIACTTATLLSQQRISVLFVMWAWQKFDAVPFLLVLCYANCGVTNVSSKHTEFYRDRVAPLLLWASFLDLHRWRDSLSAIYETMRNAAKSLAAVDLFTCIDWAALAAASQWSLYWARYILGTRVILLIKQTFSKLFAMSCFYHKEGCNTAKT